MEHFPARSQPGSMLEGEVQRSPILLVMSEELLSTSDGYIVMTRPNAKRFRSAPLSGKP